MIANIFDQIGDIMNMYIKQKLAQAGLVAAGLVAVPAAGALATTNYNDSGAGLAVAGIFASLAGFFMILALLALAAFIFWVMMLVDAINRKNWQDDNQKNTWIIILVVSLFFGLYFVSAVVYYFVIKRTLGAAKTKATTKQPIAKK